MLDLLTRKKRKEIDALLDEEYVLVFVNPRVEGVDVPEQIRNLPSATLKLSRLFRGSLKLCDDKIEAELLFGSSYYLCILPYESIWAAKGADGREAFWRAGTVPTTALAPVGEGAPASPESSPSPKSVQQTEKRESGAGKTKRKSGSQREKPTLRRIK